MMGATTAIVAQADTTIVINHAPLVARSATIITCLLLATEGLSQATEEATGSNPTIRVTLPGLPIRTTTMDDTTSTTTTTTTTHITRTLVGSIAHTIATILPVDIIISIVLLPSIASILRR